MLTTESVSHLFKSFNDKKIIVIGDVMVDSYIWGSVNRISPEAPVPVVEVEKREDRLGGAANVGLNIKALGAEAYLCSIIGKDIKGDDYMRLMAEQKLLPNGIVKSSERRTTTKFRVIGNRTQMLRVDEEVTNPLSAADQAALINAIESLIKEADIDAIVFQDYDKGVIGKTLITKVVEIAKTRNIPIAVDPKKNNFIDFKNVDLFKPNLKEIKEGLNIEFDSSKFEEIEKAVELIQQKLNANVVLNTLSEKGMFVRWRKNDGSFSSKLITAHYRDITDVSGAGDTVISVASLCLACNTEMIDLAAISNLAGGLVCEEVGVVPIDKDRLQNEVVSLIRNRNEQQ
jgi:rfaE bifunctional protein kinase chain/domain